MMVHQLQSDLVQRLLACMMECKSLHQSDWLQQMEHQQSQLNHQHKQLLQFDVLEYHQLLQNYHYYLLEPILVELMDNSCIGY